MAKTLRTSGDYKIKTGAGYNGGAGSNTIDLDSRYVRIRGDLTVDGDQIVQNVTNTTIEDQFIEVNRNNSTAGTEDSGIIFNGGSSDNAIMFFDADRNEFVMATTPTNLQDGSTTKFEVPDGNLTYRNIRVATTPTDLNHATSKNYVDTQISAIGSMQSFDIVGDDSTGASVTDGQDVQFTGGTNLSANVTSGSTHFVTLSLSQNLTDIHSVTNSSTNADLTLSANSSGSVVIDDVITFNANRSGDPSATSVTKIWAQTPSGGGTGIYFNNTSVSSGAAGEMISKSKATALAIALG